jgi:hypothetical protein
VIGSSDLGEDFLKTSFHILGLEIAYMTSDVAIRKFFL